MLQVYIIFYAHSRKRTLALYIVCVNNSLPVYTFTSFLYPREENFDTSNNPIVPLPGKGA